MALSLLLTETFNAWRTLAHVLVAAMTGFGASMAMSGGNIKHNGVVINNEWHDFFDNDMRVDLSAENWYLKHLIIILNI